MIDHYVTVPQNQQAREAIELIRAPVSSMYSKRISNTSRFDEFSLCLVALLSGARNEKNIHLYERIYNRMKKLFSHSPDQLESAAVLLANISL